MGIDRGREALAAIRDELAQQVLDLNEADTRHRFIDRLLHDVLEWPPSLIECEPHVTNVGFMDYVLTSGARVAVVEAKRSGYHFALPEGLRCGEPILLSTLIRHSTDNERAIEQVLNYAMNAGIPAAALCNGTQLVYFLGSRQDGIAPRAGRAIAYASPQEMLDNFANLWDDFSQPGLSSGYLQRRLAKAVGRTPPPEKLSASIHGYPGFRFRSELETDLSTLADLFLVDLMQEGEVSDDFIRECYCASGALSQYSAVSKEILRHRYTTILGAQTLSPVRDKRGSSTSLRTEAVSAALTRRPIVLIGDVGVGKTFFLKHLIRVDASELLSTSSVIYVDFLRESLLLEDVGLHLASAVQRVLKHDLGISVREDSLVRRAYKSELQEFSKGIYGPLAQSDPTTYALKEIQLLETLVADRFEHLRRILNQVKGERSTDFVLILDNVDHHTVDLQEQIFVMGQSLAEKWPVTAFIALRPDTFHSSLKGGSLSAYQPRVFVVPPPRVDAVIEKRLLFARKQLEETGRLESFPSGLTISSDNLLAYLDVLIGALTGQGAFIELIDNMSSGNVRSALQMISDFVGSGYVSIQRILDLDSRGGRYIMPLHELMRSLMFGDGDFYDPVRSKIPNILDVDTNDGREHFLTPMILAAAEVNSDLKRKGFCSDVGIFQSCQSAGYSPQQVALHLDWSVKRGLLEQQAEDSHNYRITQAGGYMRKVMLPRFAYLDAVVVDIPIMDASYRARIEVEHSIQDRLRRAGDLLDYLDGQWGLVGSGGYFDWSETAAKARRDLVLVRGRADRKHESDRPTRRPDTAKG